jgi:TonB family protein
LSVARLYRRPHGQARPIRLGSEQAITGGIDGASSNTHRIHVKEDVQKAKLIHKVPATYPPISELPSVGTVVLHVVIGKNGAVKSARYASGPTNLVNSTIKAVLQWRYKPTMVRGVAVEVDTTVSVVFAPLSKQEPREPTK